MNIFRKLFQRNAEMPTDMRLLTGSDPCWCGSGRAYRKCHRREDRRRLAEARGGGRIAVCEALL